MSSPTLRRDEDDVTASFELVADPRRRIALRVLSVADVPVAIADLAIEIARRECEDSDAEVDPERADRIRTALWHVHLPKLLQAGVVEFDPVRETVALGDPDASVERLLGSLPVEDARD